MGTSTPHFNPSYGKGPVVRPKLRLMRNQVLMPLDEQLTSAEEHFTAYELYNLPLSAVKMPAASLPSVPTHKPPAGHSLNRRPTLQSGSSAISAMHAPFHQPRPSRLPLQYQIIRSPVHVVHSQPAPSMSGPVCSQPLLSSNPQSFITPPAGDAMADTRYPV